MLDIFLTRYHPEFKILSKIVPVTLTSQVHMATTLVLVLEENKEYKGGLIKLNFIRTYQLDQKVFYETNIQQYNKLLITQSCPIFYSRVLQTTPPFN
jgi:hypothetical protein